MAGVDPTLEDGRLVDRWCGDDGHDSGRCERSGDGAVFGRVRDVGDGAGRVVHGRPVGVPASVGVTAQGVAIRVDDEVTRADLLWFGCREHDPSDLGQGLTVESALRPVGGAARVGRATQNRHVEPNDLVVVARCRADERSV